MQTSKLGSKGIGTGERSGRLDNGFLQTKLELRRYFLKKYHGPGSGSVGVPVVLDCCQGSGVLWRILRKEFRIDGYWGLDMKQKKGRMSIASERILQQPGWPQNVIDVDTYGSPWKHWQGIIENANKAVTVFLTFGQYQMGVDGYCLEAIGIRGAFKARIRPGMAKKILEKSVSYCLASSYDFGMIPIEIKEAKPSKIARYFGVRLEPRKV